MEKCDPDPREWVPDEAKVVVGRGGGEKGGQTTVPGGASFFQAACIAVIMDVVGPVFDLKLPVHFTQCQGQVS